MGKLSLANLKNWKVFYDDNSKEMILIYRGAIGGVSVGELAINNVFELDVIQQAEREGADRYRRIFWSGINASNKDNYSTMLMPSMSSVYLEFFKVVTKIAKLANRFISISTSSKILKLDLCNSKVNDDIYAILTGIRVVKDEDK